MLDPFAIAALVLFSILLGVIITYGYFAYRKRAAVKSPRPYPSSVRPLPDEAFLRLENPPKLSSARQYEMWETLSPRQRQVAEIVARGLSNNEVASRLGISPRTVDSYLRTVFKNLNVHSRTELANFIRDLAL